MQNKKVAILGKLSTKQYAPFWDENWDIWTLNYNNGEFPRITLWFDIHANNPNPRADITRKNYPFKAAEKLADGQYFNNSISYMIAYAILNNYEEIALYGTRFVSDREQRTAQYQNVREWMFFAKGRGIKVTAPYDPIMLQKYPLYGA